MERMNPWAMTGAAAAGAAGILAWGAVSPRAELYGPTVRRAKDAQEIALTFDDGPNPAATPMVLDLLERYGAAATFFLMGAHVRAFPELAKEIAERGHEAGNHTETHPNLALCSGRRIAEELERCNEAIFWATGTRAEAMRPPFGFRGPQLARRVREAGLKRVVMWRAMAWDWKEQPAERVIERLRGVRGGDIVLLHDGDHREERGERGHTVKALEYWMPRWADAGFRFTRAACG
jgi:peptidoglycan-N-acetylglucosamine deacetylase